MKIEGAQLAVVKDRLILPEDFDRQYESNPQFQDGIAGCTTIALNHFELGLSTSDFAIKRYVDPVHNPRPHINSSLHWLMYQSIFPDKLEFYGNGSPYYESPKENRGYGKQWGEIEVYRELGEKPQFDYEISDVTFCLDRFEDSPKSIRDVFDRTIDPSTGFNFISNFSTYFSSFEEFLFFYNEHKKRLGVQVIYGDRNEFGNYIQGLSPIEYENFNDPASISIFNDIPGKLVKYIIPVGEYEQKAFGMI